MTSKVTQDSTMTHFDLFLLYLQHGRFTCLPQRSSLPVHLIWILFFRMLFAANSSFKFIHILLSWSQLTLRSFLQNGQTELQTYMLKGFVAILYVLRGPSNSEFLNLNFSSEESPNLFFVRRPYQQVPPAPPKLDPWKLSHFFLSFISIMSKKSSMSHYSPS